MARHTIRLTHEGRPVEVAAGWDDMLGGYFADATWLDVDEDDPAARLYDNLADNELAKAEPTCHPPSLRPFLDRFGQLGLTLPASFWQAVESERRDTRNEPVIRHHGTV